MPFRSLYIHIPFCISKCSYCDFFSMPVREVADEYVDALCNEIQFRLGEFFNLDIAAGNGISNLSIDAGVGEGIRTVYIGGGTPSLLTPTQIKKITDTIYFSFSDGSHNKKNIYLPPYTDGKLNRSQIARADRKSNIDEFTIELNPDDVTVDLLHSLSGCGITRVSCGIQSLNDNTLSFCHRRANRAQVLHALDLFEKHWQDELSLDLISALPNETTESFLEGLEIVTEAKANHISLYSLTIEDETPLGKMVDCGKFDYDFDTADKMWLLGRDFLKSKGFSQYEVSNFCKDEKMSLHNLSYWNHESYIGCGSGACGTKRNADGTSIRWTNTTNIKEYINFWTAPKFPERMGECPAPVRIGEPIVSIEQIGDQIAIPQSVEYIDKQTSMFEFFMMGLRKLSGVRKSDFEKFFKTSFPESVEKLFKEWATRGDAMIVGENYSLTESGIMFLNTFLSSMKMPV